MKIFNNLQCRLGYHHLNYHARTIDLTENSTFSNMIAWCFTAGWFGKEHDQYRYELYQCGECDSFLVYKVKFHDHKKVKKLTKYSKEDVENMTYTLFDNLTKKNILYNLKFD